MCRMARHALLSLGGGADEAAFTADARLQEGVEEVE